MLTAAISESDLPPFSLLNPSSGHGSHGFLGAYFRFKFFLHEFHVRKRLFDSAHDTMPYYPIAAKTVSTPFINLNEKHEIHMKYKDDLTIRKRWHPHLQIRTEKEP